MVQSKARGVAAYWLMHAAAPLAVGALVLAWIDRRDLDLLWSDAFYRPELGGWYLRRAWWAEDVLHRGGRLVVIAAGVAALVGWLVARRSARLALWRRPALYVVATIAACASLVGILKAASDRPCPWDVARYGGASPHWPLFASAPPTAGAGRCFPSAHAATGYSLVAVYFGLRDRRRRAARWALVGALAVGTAFGFAQVARGAHFTSHNVVSALLSWYVALALYEWLLSGLRAETPSAGSSRRGDGSGSPTSRRYSRSAP